MNFRAWCHEMWLEHTDEVESWTGHRPGYTSQDYFGKYRWWLRTVYRARG